MADLLSIPREDYHHIADMAIEEAKSKEFPDREPATLVLASVYQGITEERKICVINNLLDYVLC